MRLQLSRDTKNRILIGVNLLMVLITACKLLVEPAGVSHGMQAWLAAAPLLLVLAAAPVGLAFSKVFHAGLFVVTGAAMGMTLRTVIADASTIWSAELAWLALATIAAILHYTPSSKDEYLG